MTEPITKEAIEAYRKQRVKDFSERVAALCDEFEVDIVAVPTFTNDGRTTAQIIIQPKP